MGSGGVCLGHQLGVSEPHAQVAKTAMIDTRFNYHRLRNTPVALAGLSFFLLPNLLCLCNFVAGCFQLLLVWVF